MGKIKIQVKRNTARLSPQRRVSQKNEHRLCGRVGGSRIVPFCSVDWESVLCITSKEKQKRLNKNQALVAGRSSSLRL